MNKKNKNKMNVPFKLNKEGYYVTPCPHGLKTYTTNRLKIAGYDCVGCKYREHVDYDNRVVICKKEKKKPIKKKSYGRTIQGRRCRTEE